MTEVCPTVSRLKWHAFLCVHRAARLHACTQLVMGSPTSSMAGAKWQPGLALQAHRQCSTCAAAELECCWPC